NTSYREEKQGFLFSIQPRQPVEVAPFSAGLDSLAGSARQLAFNPQLSLVSVAIGTNGRTIGRQRELFRVLSRTFGSRVRPVMVPLRLAQRHHVCLHDESTQRSRGFTYLTLAAVTAAQAGHRGVSIYENG